MVLYMDIRSVYLNEAVIRGRNVSSGLQSCRVAKAESIFGFSELSKAFSKLETHASILPLADMMPKTF